MYFVIIDTNKLTEENKEFKYNDNIGPFNLYPLYNGNIAFNPKTRPNLFYPFFLNPLKKPENEFYEIGLERHDGWVEVYPVISRKDGIQRVWRWGRDKSRKDLNKEIVGFKTQDNEFRIVQKTRHTGKVIRSLLTDKDISSRKGTAEVEDLFNSKLFTFPKPLELIKRFVSISTQQNEDIVLDFFAGSGTTAHAVLDLNKQDGGNRKFILVQLPEPCDEESSAFKDNYKTIADITKERVRRVIDKLNNEDENKIDFEDKVKNQDRGFKVFKLAESNFKTWESKIEGNVSEIGEQLQIHIDHIKQDRNQSDILYELILKSGFKLTEQITPKTILTKTIYSILDDQLMICLEEDINLEFIRALADLKPNRVICLDKSFSNKDELKANAAQIFKTKGVEKFLTV